MSSRCSPPPPRSSSPVQVVHALPSPRRKPSKLPVERSNPTLQRSLFLRSTKSEGNLKRRPKFDLQFEDFGPIPTRPVSDGDRNSILFPVNDDSDSSAPPSPNTLRRGHRRTSALTPPVVQSLLPPPSPTRLTARPRTLTTQTIVSSSLRNRSRSRSPPPNFQKSPPPPLPPMPSFLLAAGHRTKDQGGIQHIYIPDLEFSNSVSPKSAKFGVEASEPPPLTQLQFCA